MTDPAPTVVLVHGAFAESASWNGVISGLLDRGHPVVAVANPLRGVRADAAHLPAALAALDGDVVLVGHSYGGMVTSNVSDPRPITQSALEEPSTGAAWRTLPSWFLFGAEDRNIPAEAHRFMGSPARPRR